MSTRFADHLPSGDHASRPASNAVPTGTLYSCTTHGLIYQSDGASTWTTWATLGSGAATGAYVALLEVGETVADYETRTGDTVPVGAIIVQKA